MRSDLLREVTEKLKEERENQRPYITQVNGLDFVVLPGVHSPKYFQGTSICSELVPKYVNANDLFLEIGCGTGVVSCFVAKKQEMLKGRVIPSQAQLQAFDLGIREFYGCVASDISKDAQRNTRINALLHNIGGVEVRCGDLFGSVNWEERFDKIFWNVPIIDAKLGKDPYAVSVSDPNYEAFGRFLKEGQDHLGPNGKLMFSFSREWGNFPLMENLCRQAGLAHRLLEERPYYPQDTGRQIYFQLREATPAGVKK